MDQKRKMKRPPPTPEEALLDTLHERLDALPHMEELPADMDVDLLGICPPHPHLHEPQEWEGAPA